jgi:hypothetical protein
LPKNGSLTLIRSILETHADDVRQEWAPGCDLFDVQLRKRGLPIGSLTSQFFASVYLNPLDQFVKHTLRVTVPKSSSVLVEIGSLGLPNFSTKAHPPFSAMSFRSR